MSKHMTDSTQGVAPLYRWTFADFLVIGIVVAIGISSLLLQRPSDSEVTEILIFKNGVQLDALSPNENRHIDMKEYGVNMVLEVRDGRVRVLYSDCKQQICVRRDWLIHPRESVFCLPNNITVELAGDNAPYDAISR